jgi:NDP-sugar pyrophosphorylase family protein
MNGDLVTQANIADLLDFHTAGGQAATIGARRYAHTIPFGCIDVDGDRVTNMEEKPIVTQLINAGMYVIDPVVATRAQPGQELGMPSLLLDCIGRGEIVKAFQIEDDWIDVGQKDQLHRAQQGTP